jgi:hypothetical protein
MKIGIETESAMIWGGMDPTSDCENSGGDVSRRIRSRITGIMLRI